MRAFLSLSVALLIFVAGDAQAQVPCTRWAFDTVTVTGRVEQAWIGDSVFTGVYKLELDRPLCATAGPTARREFLDFLDLSTFPRGVPSASHWLSKHVRVSGTVEPADGYGRGPVTRINVRAIQMAPRPGGS